MSGTLSEVVKARVDKRTKQALLAETKRTQRSEGSILRLALLDYLRERGIYDV